MSARSTGKQSRHILKTLSTSSLFDNQTFQSVNSTTERLIYHFLTLLISYFTYRTICSFHHDPLSDQISIYIYIHTRWRYESGFVYIFIFQISHLFTKSHHPIVCDARISISLNSLPLSVFLYHFQLSFDCCLKIVHFRTLFWAIYIGLTLIINFHFSHIYISFLIP